MTKHSDKELIQLASYAYQGDFERFVTHLKDEQLLERGLVIGSLLKGIVHQNVEFSLKLINWKVDLKDNIMKVITSKLIMNNIIDEELIEKYEPFCIWYPQIPKKEIIEKLVNKHRFLNYSIAILCVLMDWFDIYENLDIKKNEAKIYELSKDLNRTKFVVEQDQYLSIIDIGGESIKDLDSFVIPRERFTRPKFGFSILLNNFNDSLPRKTFYCLEEMDEYSNRYPLSLRECNRWNLDLFMLIKDDPTTIVFHEEDPDW